MRRSRSAGRIWRCHRSRKRSNPRDERAGCYRYTRRRRPEINCNSASTLCRHPVRSGIAADAGRACWSTTRNVKRTPAHRCESKPIGPARSVCHSRIKQINTDAFVWTSGIARNAANAGFYDSGINRNTGDESFCRRRTNRSQANTISCGIALDWNAMGIGICHSRRAEPSRLMATKHRSSPAVLWPRTTSR